MFLNFLIIHNLAYNGFSFEIVSQFCTTIKVEKHTIMISWHLPKIYFNRNQIMQDSTSISIIPHLYSFPNTRKNRIQLEENHYCCYVSFQPSIAWWSKKIIMIYENFTIKKSVRNIRSINPYKSILIFVNNKIIFDFNNFEIYYYSSFWTIFSYI